MLLIFEPGFVTKNEYAAIATSFEITVRGAQGWNFVKNQTWDRNDLCPKCIEELFQLKTAMTWLHV